MAGAFLTGMFTIVPEEFFSQIGFIGCLWSETTCVIVNRVITCIVVFFLFQLAYYCYRKHRRHIIIADRVFSMIVEYGDLQEIKDGKKVINFDECFSTNVGDKPEDIKAGSICGQFLTKHPITNAEMYNLIKSSKLTSCGESLYEKRPAYTPGTIIPKDDYLLMAFAPLDENGLARFTYDKYLECLDMMWREIDRYHGIDDVYLPILGSRITRFDKELTQQDLLDIMISSYRLSNSKLKNPNKIHIVCSKREGFSLNHVFGI